MLRHAHTLNWLVVRGVEKTSWWHLPGGGVEEGEPPSWAVVREIRQELTLSPPNHPHLLTVAWTEASSSHLPGKVTFVFDLGLVPADAPIVPATQEIAEWGWRDPATLPQLLHPLEAQRFAAIQDARACDTITFCEQRRAEMSR